MIIALLFGCAEVVQTPACADYLVCLSARDAELGITTDVARFEVDGGCWGSEDGAALCDRACSSGLTWLRDNEANLPEACAP